MTKQELIDHLQHLEKYTHYSEDAPALREVIKMLRCSEIPNSSDERTDKRTGTHACDCISRQAAIAHAVPLNLFGREVMMVSVSELENLPSAQPDLSEYSDKLWRNAYERGKRDAQPEQQWISCDKGEPDEDMECWVTVKTTDTLYRGNFTKRYGERRDKGFITSGGFMWWNTALAWMPIYEPEPYRPEGDDKHEG